MFWVTLEGISGGTSRENPERTLEEIPAGIPKGNQKVIPEEIHASITGRISESYLGGMFRVTSEGTFKHSLYCTVLILFGMLTFTSLVAYTFSTILKRGEEFRDEPCIFIIIKFDLS